MAKFIEVTVLSGKHALVNLDNVTEIMKETIQTQNGVNYGCRVYFNTKHEDEQANLFIKNDYDELVDRFIEEKVLL